MVIDLGAGQTFHFLKNKIYFFFTRTSLSARIDKHEKTSKKE
jgi:hypothetical protein